MFVLFLLTEMKSMGTIVSEEVHCVKAFQNSLGLRNSKISPSIRHASVESIQSALKSSLLSRDEGRY